MKYFIKNLVFALALCYLFGIISFVDFDIRNWDEPVRVCLCAIAIAIAFAKTGIDYEMSKKNS